MSKNGKRVIYHANHHILRRMWYDWAYLHFEEVCGNSKLVESFYPAKNLAFVKFDKSSETEAVVQCTEQPLVWSSIKKHFLIKVVLGTDDEVSMVTVPLTSLVHPLCVILDYGGNGTSYIAVLPKRNWSRFFGDRIKSD